MYLDRGGNLVDTSANYTDGQSERLVGRVIKDYPRDGLILVTKGGYIQGQNMALAKSRSFPEVVAYADGLWHCIHPEFLETQIRLSAGRMQVETTDLYLLHNPEYYLNHTAHQGWLTPADHDEFYRQLSPWVDRQWVIDPTGFGIQASSILAVDEEDVRY